MNRDQMSDDDTIAYLLPAEGKGRENALAAICMSHNAAYFVPGRSHKNLHSEPRKAYSRSAREDTEQPEEDDAQSDEPRLRFTFSNPPKTRQGLVAGCSPAADILLPFKSVSWHHFALTFDAQNHLVVRDLNSTMGTRVAYDDQDGAPGRGMDWSACPPPLAKGNVAVVKVLESLQFRLIVPHRNTRSKEYLDNVARFREGTGSTEDLFRDIKLLSRVATELPTPVEKAHQFAPGTVFWKKELGRGTFGTVYYIWNATTRDEFALKEPRSDNAFIVEMWRKEAEILKDISHKHIVELKHTCFLAGKPKLYFEYVPGGSLDTYLSKTTSFHNKQIAIQLFSVLSYLHGLPLAHRDIKLENVLVQSWDCNGVYVKLADFGLSKQSSVMETYCGTQLYAAPEIYSLRENPKYDLLVDIWSVGVLLVWLECRRLPKYKDGYQTSGTAWAEALVKFVHASLRRHGDRSLVSFVIEDMLEIRPERRRSALECHSRALQLFGSETIIQSVELTAPGKTTDHSSPPSSDEDSGDESDPATPRALRVGTAAASREIGTSLIAELGHRDTDSALGLRPSDSSEFGRSTCGLVEGSEAERTTRTGWNDNTGTLDSSMTRKILGTVADYVNHGEETAEAADVEAINPLSQCKRSRLDYTEGDGVSKRSKAAHCEVFSLE